MNLNELRELYQHREHYNLLVKALTKHYDEISEQDLLTVLINLIKPDHERIKQVVLI